MHRKTLRQLVALAIVTSGSSASVATDLREALRTTYENNARIAAQVEHFHEVEEQVVRARAKSLPQLAVSAETGPRHREQLYSIPALQDLLGTSGTSTQRDVGASLDLALYRGGSNVAAVRDARAAVRAELARTKVTVQTVLLDAAKAYFAVVHDESIAQLRQEFSESLRVQLELVTERLRAQEAVTSDLSQTRARLLESEVLLRRVESQVSASRADYERIVGESPQALVPESTPLLVPQNLAEAVQLAESRSPELLAAMWDEERADARIGIARGARRPRLDLSLSTSRYYFPNPADNGLPAPDETRDAAALLKLTIPLYQGGAASSDLRAARRSQASATALVEERRRTAISAARVAWNNLVSARANIATARLQVTASTEALGDIRMQRDIGSRTTTDVLDAEREVLQARILLVEIETDARLAAAQVSAATGQLAMEQLEADLQTTPLRAPEH